MGEAAGSTSSRRLVDTGGLIVTDPNLPVSCYLKTKVQGILFFFLYIVVGKFFVCPLCLYLQKKICLSLLGWLLLTPVDCCKVDKVHLVYLV
jgi:hypothetical protein